MLTIRNEQSGDSQAIHATVAAAFGHSAEADLVDQLRTAGDSVISLVASEDHQIVAPGPRAGDEGAADQREARGEAPSKSGASRIVGHVLLSRMEAPFPALALAPVAVVPARQRRGIGKALIQAAVDLARNEGWAAIFVLGDPGYYQRFGFDRAAAAGFSSPYAGPHFMVLSLLPSLPTPNGEVRHALAFASLG